MHGSLSASDLSFRYPGTDRSVFTDIRLEIRTGEVLTLLGPNGTGKSTLLKCLAGLLPPSGGNVILAGRHLSTMQPHEIAKKIGFVPQSQVSAFPYLVKDIVLMGRASHLGVFQAPKSEDEVLVESILKLVGISDLSRRPCNQISGGEWQLVLIARAIAQEPDLLLLDEPTSHLDLGNQMKVLEVIARLKKQGLTIIIATHFPDHAFLVSDTVAILKDASLRLTGSPEEVITDQHLEDVYGIPVDVVSLVSHPGRQICVPLWPDSDLIKR